MIMKHLVSILIWASLLFPFIVVAEGAKTRIAAIVPLTGPVSEFGIASRNAMELFNKEDRGSCAIEIIWDDSRYDGATTVSAYRNLASQSIDAVYVWGAAPAQALVPLTERDNVPTLAVTIEPAARPWK